MIARLYGKRGVLNTRYERETDRASFGLRIGRLYLLLVRAPFTTIGTAPYQSSTGGPYALVQWRYPYYRWQIELDAYGVRLFAAGRDRAVASYLFRFPFKRR